MKLGKATQRVLLRDVQMHPFRHEVLHIDFQRVDENKKIHMKVPLHFVNAEVSPAVKLAGAIISHVLNELDIACLPKDLPEFIEVDLSTIEIGHSVHVSDLKLAEGVTAVTHGKDPVVATAVVPKVIVEAEETAAADAEAAPVDDRGGSAGGRREGAGDAKPGDKKEAREGRQEEVTRRQRPRPQRHRRLVPRMFGDGPFLPRIR